MPTGVRHALAYAYGLQSYGFSVVWGSPLPTSPKGEGTFGVQSVWKDAARCVGRCRRMRGQTQRHAWADAAACVDEYRAVRFLGEKSTVRGARSVLAMPRLFQHGHEDRKGDTPLPLGEVGRGLLLLSLTFSSCQRGPSCHRGQSPARSAWSGQGGWSGWC